VVPKECEDEPHGVLEGLAECKHDLAMELEFIYNGFNWIRITYWFLGLLLVQPLDAFPICYLRL
jgi:hypothetical protein